MGKSLLSLATAVSTAGLFGAWGHSVQAQNLPGVSDVIAFTAETVVTSDGATLGCGDALPDAAVVAGQHAEIPAIDQIGGCGTMSFVSTLCADYSDGEPALPVEAGLCSFASAAGLYNTVCGTGGVTTGNASAGANVAGMENASMSYSITFTASIGVVTGTFTDTSGDGAGQWEPILGVVQLGPAENPNTQDGPVDCTNAFSVIGVFVVEEGGTS